MENNCFENDFLKKIKEMQSLEKNIEEKRIAETQKVDVMTEQEAFEYLLQKEVAADKTAQRFCMKQKQVVSSDKKDG